MSKRVIPVGVKGAFEHQKRAGVTGYISLSADSENQNILKIIIITLGL